MFLLILSNFMQCRILSSFRRNSNKPWRRAADRKFNRGPRALALLPALPVGGVGVLRARLFRQRRPSLFRGAPDAPTTQPRSTRPIKTDDGGVLCALCATQTTNNERTLATSLFDGC